MRFCWLFEIGDERTHIIWLFWVNNRTISAVLGFLQLTIAVVSLYQHVFSVVYFQHIFFCQSNITADATLTEHFLAYDIIIFDYGLMHRVLGTTECVANYLDGGYMRGLWCLEQMTALLTMYAGLYCFPRYTWMLWPALLVQSSYALGLAVLTMATAPKLLEAIGGKVTEALFLRLSIFIGGILVNWLFTLTLWHHYWFVDDRLHGRHRQVFQI
uniref:Uncharacterized protein n=1 Tax=Plectus sambesii TaxID=2011161 RepID=A0A914WI47_9BILA